MDTQTVTYASNERILTAFENHDAGSMRLAKYPLLKQRQELCLTFARYNSIKEIAEALPTIRVKEWIPATFGLLWNPLMSETVETFTTLVNMLPGKYLRATFFRTRTEMPYLLVELLAKNPQLMNLIAQRVTETDPEAPSQERGYDIIKTALYHRILDYPQLPAEFRTEAALSVLDF